LAGCSAKTLDVRPIETPDAMSIPRQTRDKVFDVVFIRIQMGLC